MTDQLVLIEIEEVEAGVEYPWQLSPAVREVGRRGVAMAMKALQHARSGSATAMGDPPTRTAAIRDRDFKVAA